VEPVNGGPVDQGVQQNNLGTQDAFDEMEESDIIGGLLSGFSEYENILETITGQSSGGGQKEHNIIVKIVVLEIFRIAMNRYVEEGVIDVDEIKGVYLKLSDNYITIELKTEKQLLIPFFDMESLIHVKTKERAWGDMGDLEFEIDIIDEAGVELIQSLFHGDAEEIQENVLNYIQ